MKKNWKNGVRAGLVMLALAPAAAWADPSPIGNWVRTSGTVKIAVTQCGGNYCAVNTWVKDPGGPEKIGDKLILTVQPISGSEFKGKAYDVRRQMTYKMTITFEGNDMKTSGCVLLGIICKSTEWTKIN